MLSKEVLFSFFPKCTHTRYRTLIRVFSSLEHAWTAELDDLKKTKWQDDIIAEFLTWRDKLDANRIEEMLEKRSIRAITKTDEEYPALLKDIFDPPLCLFVRGSTLPTHRYYLAVVGPRKNTPYGKHITELFIAQLAQAGITIVSGLAYGIDAIAHRATLQAGGHTVAVLGGGVNKEHVQPAQNQRLAEDILQAGGALMAEYPPGTIPTRYTFPRRNRIISGISLGTLVIEAGESSGSLITAQCSIDNHRDVFAVPQNITSQMSIGVNKLIQSGAHPVISPDDVLNILDLGHIKKHIDTQKELPGTEEERQILDHISQEPKHVDEIVRELKLPSSKITSTLTIMEMKGMVKNLGMMHYIKK